jgi:hypothetical protein
MAYKSLLVYYKFQCRLRKLPKNCSIYLYTCGGCDNCGHNIKLDFENKKKVKAFLNKKLNNNIKILGK